MTDYFIYSFYFYFLTSDTEPKLSQSRWDCGEHDGSFGGFSIKLTLAIPVPLADLYNHAKWCSDMRCVLTIGVLLELRGAFPLSGCGVAKKTTRSFTMHVAMSPNSSIQQHKQVTPPQLSLVFFHVFTDIITCCEITLFSCWHLSTRCN